MMLGEAVTKENRIKAAEKLNIVAQVQYCIGR